MLLREEVNGGAGIKSGCHRGHTAPAPPGLLSSKGGREVLPLLVSRGTQSHLLDLTAFDIHGPPVRPQKSFRHRRSLCLRPTFNGSATAPVLESQTRARLWRFLACRSRFPERLLICF